MRQRGMLDTDNPSLLKRLRAIGVSASYASEIASGSRKPSLSLALRIYRETGEQVGTLVGKSKHDIAVLERAQRLQEGGAA